MIGSVVARSDRTAVRATRHGMLGQIAPAMPCELEVVVVGTRAHTHGVEQKSFKRIRQCSDLVSTLDPGHAASANQEAFAMADLRARSFHSRPALFAAAAERLAHRVAPLCRICSAVGLARTDNVRGTTCRSCRWPVPTVRAEVSSSRNCEFRIEWSVDESDVRPGTSRRCDP